MFTFPPSWSQHIAALTGRVELDVAGLRVTVDLTKTRLERVYLPVLALLNERDENRPAMGFDEDRLMAYYSHADRMLKVLFRRGLVIKNDQRYALFSTVFGRWIRDELGARMRSHQTYEEWLRNPANQGRLAQIKAGFTQDVKEKLLPELKGAYWGLVVNWLTNPETLENAYTLLRSWLSR